jgi:hypothetical protein
MAQAGARAGLGLGGITCLLVALLGLLAVRRLRAGTPRTTGALSAAR